MELSEIGEIIFHNQDVVVIIDEAYNLLIVQTFSKSRALAGLRIGYAFGSPQLIRHLNAVKNSFYKSKSAL